MVWIKGERSLITLDLSTDGQHIVERAFGNQPLLPIRPLLIRPLHDNTQPFAHKVIGQFVNFLLGRSDQTDQFGLGNNCLVERVRQPGLENGVEVGVTLYKIRWLALHIKRAIKLHHPSGQRASFVGAEHIHAAQIFDGTQAAHDHAAFRHHLRPFGQIDADNRGQQFGSHAHGQGNCEEQGFNCRALKEDIDRKGYNDQGQHYHGEQITKAPNAMFKVGLRRAQL